MLGSRCPWRSAVFLAGLGWALVAAAGAGLAATACRSEPWVNAVCEGAVGDGVHDDTAALRRAVGLALGSDSPLLLPPGRYKLSGTLRIDYTARARTGFRLISMGATLDGRAVAAGPVLTVACSGGSAAAPKGCFYFKEEGSLFVDANSDGYAVVIGNPDFSDAQNSIKLDHLIVNNANRGARAGGLQLNYVLDADIFAVADSAGGGAGIALEQLQFSRLSGAGSASAAGGAGLLIENGYTFANTIAAIDLEVAPTCLAITSVHAAHNTFVSPYFACPTAVDARAGDATLLLNPLFAGNVATRFAHRVGIFSLPSAAGLTLPPPLP